MKPSIEEMFWAKVRKDPSGCWLWTGGGMWAGYGQFSVGGNTTRVHRYSYELHKGPIPEGLVIDHTCRVRSCVNPDHLDAVTQQENVRRSPLSPHRRTHCPAGHPYNEANTCVGPDGKKRCRPCDRDRKRAMKESMRREEAPNDADD